MLKSRVKNWTPAIAPLGLCAFVLALSAMPYLLFRRDQGSFGAFTSAYDESTYLLDVLSAPYRLLSDLLLTAVTQLTPGSDGLLVIDLLLPLIVALAAWALVTRCLTSTGLQVLAVLLLLFGQELFSLANSIVWPGSLLFDLRTSNPPLSLELIPDATTSYFSLFRTPEPQVSWVVLLGFLALIVGPDPLRAFEGSRRWLTYPIFAVLPIIYPFISVPVLVLSVALLGFATGADRRRAVGVLMALGIAAASWAAVSLAAAESESDTSSVAIFDSRVPTVTPAILLGVALAVYVLIVYRAQVFRRAELLIVFVASVLPAAVGNQQIITGFMVSTRDWERNSSYALVIFAVIALIGMRERSTRSLPPLAGKLAWVGAAVLAVSLVAWQREVYRAWSPTNVQSHQAADLLYALPDELAAKPIVMEEASLVPLVRLLTDDDFEFVLDYTRLYEDRIPDLADDWENSDVQAASQERIFEYWFRLGRSPADVEAQLNAELIDITVPGFYSHFLFSLRDVWPPLTDSRGLHRDAALQQVPAIVDAYDRFVHERNRSPGPPVLLITNSPPDGASESRRLELLASAADNASGASSQIYLERAR